MSCEGFFEPYVAWAEADLDHNWVVFNLISNQENGVCGYASGRFNYKPGTATGEPPLTVSLPGTFDADGVKQFFSDRLTPDNDPFNPAAPDSIGVRLTLSDPPHVRLKLNSWGGGYLGFSVECRNGVLIGAPPGAVIVISLQQRAHPG